MSYHLTSAMKLNANQDEWSAPRAGHLSPKPPHLHSKTSHRAKTTKQVRWAAEVLVYEIPANENSAGRKVTRGKRSSKRRSSTPRKSPQQLAAESGPTAKTQNSSAKAAEETDLSPVPESRDHSHRERVKQQKPVPPAVPQIHTKAKPFKATKVKYFPVTVTHGPDHRFCGCHDGFYEVQYLEDDLPNSGRKSRKSNSADKVDLQMEAARNHINNSRGNREASPGSYEESDRKDEKMLDFTDRRSLIGHDFTLYDDDGAFSSGEINAWPQWN